MSNETGNRSRAAYADAEEDTVRRDQPGHRAGLGQPLFALMTVLQRGGMNAADRARADRRQRSCQPEIDSRSKMPHGPT
jgi:hypothetical protein